MHQKSFWEVNYTLLLLIFGLLGVSLLKCSLNKHYSLVIHYNVGDSEIDQLFKIFRLLGTPTNEDWKEVETLPDYKPNFPHWPAKDLKTVFPKLEDTGIDLMEQLLTYSPGLRISAKRALLHEYFEDLEE